MTAPIIIDVREPAEYAQSHVSGAINLPASALVTGLPEALENTKPNNPIIVYCRSGARSAAAIQILQRHGFTNLTNGINQQQVESRFL